LEGERLDGRLRAKEAVPMRLVWIMALGVGVCCFAHGVGAQMVAGGEEAAIRAV